MHSSFPAFAAPSPPSTPSTPSTPLIFDAFDIPDFLAAPTSRVYRPFRIRLIFAAFAVQRRLSSRLQLSEMANSIYEYVKKFEMEDKLPPCNWIIVRIDGCNFHGFSDTHGFDKPNDENALNLMNSCATSMVEHFTDIVFAYGVSDEYSFIWNKTSQSFGRRASKILSYCVSYFTSMYVIRWKDFFPHKDLKIPPYFDARVVLYPRAKIVKDYLSWRQVDCHINNQYNTCFWMLIKSGKSKKEAQEQLKGTLAKDKNELLFQQFGINYNELPDIFKKGSCVYKDHVEITKQDDCGNLVKRRREQVTVGHFDIIRNKFWDEHPYILEED